jgi:N utilization substance protein A
MSAIAVSEPVSALLDHGLAEPVLDLLLAGGVTTVEKLGSMTPEDLEAIEGIEPEMIDGIGAAVNRYYGNYEAEAEEAPIDEPAAAELQNEAPLALQEESVTMDFTESEGVPPSVEPKEAVEAPSDAEATAERPNEAEERG